MKKGNKRFVDGEPRSSDDIGTLREKLAEEGQEPIATIMACSDSRIPVEDIFSQPLGRLFVVSTAGNTANVHSEGTVRYGVEHLHTPVVVVLGHNHCGAIKAVVVDSEESGALGEMLEDIYAVRRTLDDIGEDEEAERALAIANVNHTADELLRDDLLRAKVDQDEVWLMRAMYDIKTGVVEWLGKSGRD
ncbi:MAG: hypothetical protein LUC93_01880 [Planctomycetaceae bacterium]|nr:hypothetical protein [Planctomycetaceae bacterium]